MNTYQVNWYVLGTILRPPYSGTTTLMEKDTDSAVASAKIRVAGQMLFNVRDVYVKSVTEKKEQVS